jgi:hypothetical protein
VGRGAGLPSPYMKLITAHRVLITAGIAFFVFYMLLQGRMFFVRGGSGPLVQAVVSAAIVIGLVLYYRSLRGWGRR